MLHWWKYFYIDQFIKHCKNGDLVRAKKLLRSDRIQFFEWLYKDFKLVDSECNYLVKYAAKNGKMELFEFLFDNKALINIDNYYPLREAIRNDHLDIARFIIDHTNGNKAVEQALLLSAQIGNFELLKYCIETGINPDVNNCSALQWSMKNKHYKIVKYLIEIGANTKILQQVDYITIIKDL